VNLKSPYRGLAAFADSDLDALYFFGRERDSEIVVANLIASRLTVLYGPSGVGKSSLLLASVARALRRLPERPIVLVFSSWSEPPERALAEAIAEAAGIEPGSLVDVATRAQAERDDPARSVLLLAAGGGARPADVDDALANRGRGRDTAVELSRPHDDAVGGAGGDDPPVVCPEDDSSLCDRRRHLDQALSGNHLDDPKRRSER